MSSPIITWKALIHMFCHKLTDMTKNISVVPPIQWNTVLYCLGHSFDIFLLLGWDDLSWTNNWSDKGCWLLSSTNLTSPSRTWVGSASDWDIINHWARVYRTYLTVSHSESELVVCVHLLSILQKTLGTDHYSCPLVWPRLCYSRFDDLVTTKILIHCELYVCISL